jgi:BirA family transcriptional regulator, biotin operon repressor / biotin---[acetyl-CoA-carboxylase] ligase
VALQKSGISALHFESLDSTNAEALRQLALGTEGPLWIVADEQTEGRGRAGRRWQSPKGNLYATLGFRPGVAASIATQLSFVAALAAFDAIASQLPVERHSGLHLKWPNDVLLGGAKIAGILIESIAGPKGNGLAAAIGIGINVGLAPQYTGRPVAALGLDPGARTAVFETLARAFAAWLARWDEGRGFAGIRDAWLARAHVIGEPLNVSLNGSSIRGRFHGLDERGALQLETDAGSVITVSAGDIYPAPMSD